MANTNQTQAAPQGVAKTEPTQSERFTSMVLREFTAGTGEVALTKFQKRLCQNYFMVIDSVLKTAEEKRLKKDENKRDRVPIIWQNINMELLARNVVSSARIGLDPAIKNHIHMIPYKNNTTQKYDITFMEGYRGMEIKAMKYGLDVPKKVIVKVVYSTDKFEPIYQDKDNPIETYIFKVVNPFDRGEIIGGFYYYQYEDSSKNKLMFYNIKEIEKRKPAYASTEFWGGEKDIWEKDETTGRSKKTGTQKVEGWFEEMVYKTLSRAAYNNITIDSQKIDDDFLTLQANEREKEMDIKEEITTKANKETISFEEAEVVDEKVDHPLTPEQATPKQAAPKAEQNGQQQMPGW